MYCDGYYRYFFIDYENVNRDGLNGIAKLSEKDCVRIYYSNSAQTITFGLHRRINESKAHIEYIKVWVPIKNAVDCKILFDIEEISRLNSEAKYFIVSKDSDYDKPIDVFGKYKVNIKRVSELCKADGETDNKRIAQVQDYFEQYLKVYDEYNREIIQIVLNGKSKQQINNELMKLYENDIVSDIYKRLKPLIKDLPGR